MAEADWQQMLNRPAIQCSQGGVPFNDFHLKEKDAIIASLRTKLAEARAALKAEREACAVLCEQQTLDAYDEHERGYNVGCVSCADAIRARKTEGE